MKDAQSTLKKSCLVEFRFHPNATATPGSIPTSKTATAATTNGSYGSTDIKAITCETDGIWKVELWHKHEHAIAMHATYHTTTAPGTMDVAKVYNVSDGAAASNTFYVNLWLTGAASSPVFSASNYIAGFVEYDELE